MSYQILILCWRDTAIFTLLTFSCPARYQLAQNFLPILEIFWQLGCQATALFPPLTKSATTRRVGDDELPADWEEANYSSGDEDVVCRVEDRKWLGVQASSKTAHIRMVARERNTARDRWVNMQVGGTRLFLYADTGSRFTIITPNQYKEDKGEVVAADTRMRAWGARGYLDVRGMFHTTLRLDKGATKETWVYVVDGYRAEALLGDRDAEDLSIISFNKDGREEDQVGGSEVAREEGLHRQDTGCAGHRQGEGQHHGDSGQVQRHVYLIQDRKGEDQAYQAGV